MSFSPMGPQMKIISKNPIENMIDSLNTNPYLIGSMMLLLNLGGRHLSGGLTPEQDKFFQQPWFRCTLFFVVFFVATRNIMTSFWMSLLIVLCINYIFNEQSSFYLFKATLPKKKVIESSAPAVAPTAGLTPEESEIHRKLTEKIDRLKMNSKKSSSEEKDFSSELTITYNEMMSKI